MPNVPMPILNAANIPLNYGQGTIPNMSESITDWFQPLSFVNVVKTVVAFEVLETPTTTNFLGVFMPYSPRNLELLAEGQRAWTIILMYSQPQLPLQVDDVVVFPQLNQKQTRVMSREDYGLYSYIKYSLIQDWTGSGP